MKMSRFFGLLAASALVFAGCETKGGAGDDAYGVGDGGAYAGGDVGVNPNDATFDPNDPNVGAFGSGRFSETRERVLDADLSPLYFTFDSSALPLEEQDKATAAAEYLMEHPHIAIFEDGKLRYEISREYVGEEDELTVTYVGKSSVKEATTSLDNMGYAITVFEY